MSFSGTEYFPPLLKVIIMKFHCGTYNNVFI